MNKSIESFTPRATGMVAAFLFLFSILLSCSASAAENSINGIYALFALDTPMPLNNGQLKDALAKPFVDGAYLKVSWSSVEPQPGQYDWTYLDSQVKVLTALHKKISIGIFAGRRTPEWLYSMGAQSFDSVVQVPRQKDFCQPIKLPVPWDPVFQQRWKQLVEAFGAHFSDNPSVVLVKVTGIAQHTDEILLPHSPGKLIEARGVTCNIQDDIKQWTRLGYNSEKITRAFEKIFEDFSKAFPTKHLALMTGEKPFPPIGIDGKRDESAATLPETQYFDYGRQKLGSRFVAQVNSLSAFRVDRKIAEFGASSPIGYQAAWPVTNDDTCQMNGGRKPCDPLMVMKKSIDTAISTHARYVELFPVDLVNPAFVDDLARLHKSLVESDRVAH